jgi:hypothetical protein
MVLHLLKVIGVTLSRSLLAGRQIILEALHVLFRIKRISLQLEVGLLEYNGTVIPCAGIFYIFVALVLEWFADTRFILINEKEAFSSVVFIQ